MTGCCALNLFIAGCCALNLLCLQDRIVKLRIDGLVQQRRNSIQMHWNYVTNPSICNFADSISELQGTYNVIGIIFAEHETD